MLGQDQVAVALGVSPSTVARMRRAGSLPAHVTLGEKLIRWRAADIAAFVDGKWQPGPAK
jgi:excisionase family DNA binding protein